jgi:hypothetical protein
MAGRVLRDSKGRYAGSTRGWGRGVSRGGKGGASGGGRIKKKGSGVIYSRPAAVGMAIKRGVSVGGPIAALNRRSPSALATAAAVASVTGAQTYRKARTGRL